MRERDDKTNLRDKLVASFAKGMAILRGEMEPAPFHPAPAAVDVCAVRKKLSLTQEGFARRFGFGPATVRTGLPQALDPLTATEPSGSYS